MLQRKLFVLELMEYGDLNLLKVSATNPWIRVQMKFIIIWTA